MASFINKHLVHNLRYDLTGQLVEFHWLAEYGDVVVELLGEGRVLGRLLFVWQELPPECARQLINYFFLQVIICHVHSEQVGGSINYLASQIVHHGSIILQLSSR